MIEVVMNGMCYLGTMEPLSIGDLTYDQLI